MAEQRLAIAGVRLAAILNAIFGEDQASKGFVITDLTIAPNGSGIHSMRLFEVSEKEPVGIGEWKTPGNNTTVLNFTSGLPISSGSTLTSEVVGGGAVWLVVSGYVY